MPFPAMPRKGLDTLAMAVAFAAAAALCRSLLRETETRWQITVFAILVITAELFVRRWFGLSPSLRRAGINLLAVIAAMIAVKLMIEGPPHYVYWVRRLTGIRL